MDILAARKKAAERARAGQAPEAAASPEAQTAPATEAPQAAEAERAVPAHQAAAPQAEQATPEPQTASGEGRQDAERATAPEVDLLTFRVSGEAYAVFVDDVREVVRLRELTRVPNAPGFMLGVMSLRGVMLPVVDLAARLDLKAPARDEKARIIVVCPDDEDVGIVVDRVTGVIRIRPDAIRPAPEHVEKGAEFLSGIVRHDEKLYIVLDLKKTAG